MDNGYPAAFLYFRDSAAIRAVTVVSVSFILTTSNLPQPGQFSVIMLGESNFIFGFAPQLEHAYPFIPFHTSV